MREKKKKKQLVEEVIVTGFLWRLQVNKNRAHNRKLNWGTGGIIIKKKVTNLNLFLLLSYLENSGNLYFPSFSS